MKLKYYLRGMGIGIILTAIVMGFALGGRKATISDAEVIERAKALGMIDPTSGVLTQTTDGADENEENTSTSSEALDQTGEEISEEVDEEFASYGESFSGLDETTVEGTEETESKAAEETTTVAESSEDTKPAEEVEREDTVVAEEVKEEAKEPEKTQSTEENNKSETEVAKASEPAQTEETPQNNTSGLGSKTTVTKTVTIPGGLGSDQVAAILAREGIVDSAYSFNQYLCDNRMDRIIRSGQKIIPAGSTYQDIANIICK